MRVLSFGHIITNEVKVQIQEKYPNEEISFESIPFHLQMGKSFFVQVEDIIKPHLKNPELPFIILPGVSVACAIIVTIIHGHYGQFPFIIELTRRTTSSGEWKVKEVHNLSNIRNIVREKRFDHPQTYKKRR